MKIRSFTSGLVVGAGAMLIVAAMSRAFVHAAAEVAQDQEAEALSNYQRYGTPGPEHEALAAREGDWNARAEFWPAPGAEPIVNQSRSTFRMIMDGRFLAQEFSATFGDTQFSGAGLTAFDRLGRKYQSIWIDSWSTGIAFTEGTRAENGDVVFKGTFPDAAAGRYIDTRCIERTVDDDTHIFEMWKPGPDGEEFMSMRITYTRVKE